MWVSFYFVLCWAQHSLWPEPWSDVENKLISLYLHNRFHQLNPRVFLLSLWSAVDAASSNQPSPLSSSCQTFTSADATSASTLPSCNSVCRWQRRCLSSFSAYWNFSLKWVNDPKFYLIQLSLLGKMSILKYLSSYWNILLIRIKSNCRDTIPLSSTISCVQTLRKRIYWKFTSVSYNSRVTRSMNKCIGDGMAQGD